MSTASPYALYLSRLSSSSQQSIRSQLRSIARIMQWPLDDHDHFHRINYEEAIKVRAMLAHEGWSARSINRAMVAVKGIVKVAVMMGKADQIQSLQLQTISRMKHGEHQGTCLTTTQVEALFKHLTRCKRAHCYRNTAIFAVLLGTGLRRSELCKLEIADYRMAERRLLVRSGKGNKSRELFLPEWAVLHLKSWLDIRQRKDGLMFCRVMASGKFDISRGLSSSTIYRLVQDTFEGLGISGVTPHDLRRTFITRLLEQKVDINTVRQMAGHAEISTTTIYDKRDHQFMRQAADALNYTPKGNSS
ncbi:MAG: site-specific integrase [Idiomarina sp.]|nr:site-specific integrase [Idiomarina sp.]